MSFITVDLRGGSEAAAALARAPERVLWHVQRALRAFTQEAARQMKRDAPKANSLLTNSIQATPTGPLEFSVGPTVRYSRYVEDGTLGGGWPPDEALRRWIRRKRIRPRVPTMNEDDLVYVIGRAIHRRGTPAQPFVEPIAESPFFRQRAQALVEGGLAAVLREIAS